MVTRHGQLRGATGARTRVRVRAAQSARACGLPRTAAAAYDLLCLSARADSEQSTCACERHTPNELSALADLLAVVGMARDDTGSCATLLSHRRWKHAARGKTMVTQDRADGHRHHVLQGIIIVPCVALARGMERLLREQLDGFGETPAASTKALG